MLTGTPALLKLDCGGLHNHTPLDKVVSEKKKPSPMRNYGTKPRVSVPDTVPEQPCCTEEKALHREDQRVYGSFDTTQEDPLKPNMPHFLYS